MHLKMAHHEGQFCARDSDKYLLFGSHAKEYVLRWIIMMSAYFLSIREEGDFSFKISWD